MSKVALIECPRDAMQGWKHFISTADKVRYLNALLRVGFDTIDFGSFVSAKAIPQMADTRDVITQLDLQSTSSKLLAIVANVRGAEDAIQYDEISFLGFPFSVSPTFQLKNTNSTIEESLGRVEEIQEQCVKHNKKLVVYLSMGFGNPYGDVYSEAVLLKWAAEMVKRGIGIISVADTVGLATPAQVHNAVASLVQQYPSTTIGVHLHATPSGWKRKLEAAVNAGCIRFDGALKGIGGCPMAQDELVGNMNTENIIDYLRERKLLTGINYDALNESLRIADQIFV